jgi:hypothetical protein
VLKTIGLIASMCVNAALLVALLRTESVADTRRVGPSGAPQPVAARGYYERLLSLGLDAHEARGLLIAELEASTAAGLAEPADRYWQPSRLQYAEHALTLAAAQTRVRAELTKVFGTAAEMQLEFARVFRPLDPAFRFLSSAEQIALQDLRLRQRLERAEAPEQSLHCPADPERADSRVGAGEGDAAALRAVLSADAAFEVGLRESPLAEQLRASGAQLTEAEFRAAYELLRAPEAVRGPEQQLALRRRLKTLLGARRFDRIWAQRDPLAPLIRRVGTELDLDADAIERAYVVLNASQERLLELAALSDPAGEGTIARARAIAEDERRELERAVGKGPAAALLDARTEYLLSASRALPRVPPTGR